MKLFSTIDRVRVEHATFLYSSTLPLYAAVESISVRCFATGRFKSQLIRASVDEAIASLSLFTSRSLKFFTRCSELFLTPNIFRYKDNVQFFSRVIRKWSNFLVVVSRMYKFISKNVILQFPRDSLLVRQLAQSALCFRKGNSYGLNEKRSNTGCETRVLFRSSGSCGSV